MLFCYINQDEMKCADVNIITLQYSSQKSPCDST